MMKKIFILFSALSFVQVLIAQNTYQKMATERDNPPEIINRVKPQQDLRLNDMVEWQIESNNKKNGIDGWRVEIFFSSDSDAKVKALKVKQEFLSMYPDLEVHILFVAPNFRVRVGDFRTRNEALKIRKQVMGKYPKSFEVKDVIKFPELKQVGSLKNQE